MGAKLYNDSSIVKVIIRESQAEIYKEKSRFIATVCIVDSEALAKERINTLRKQYWDATHNCFAYVIGYKGEILRCSDDGEPQGTAGRPILDIIESRDLKNILVVVTRYFGGTLLGRGGLVRAYADSTVAGIEASDIGMLTWVREIDVVIDYPDYGKIEYYMDGEGYKPYEISYSDKVRVKIYIPEIMSNSFIKDIIELTNGKGLITDMGCEYRVVDMTEQEV